MMPTDPQQLPDDIAALKAMVLAAHAKEASADQQRLALEAEIAAHETAIAQMNAATMRPTVIVQKTRKRESRAASGFGVAGAVGSGDVG